MNYPLLSYPFTLFSFRAQRGENFLRISTRLVLARKRRGGRTRVLRGGSWNNEHPRNLLSSNRNNDTPTNRNDNNGIRVVVAGGGSR